MSEIFSRNKMFWGEEAQAKLAKTSVCVFGLGGVGGYSCEMLARSGVENLTIIDFDKVSTSNINRQIVALHSTIGKSKAILFKERLLDINPNININVIDEFYIEEFDFSNIDYVIDAIDTIRSKVNLLSICHRNKIPVVTSLGAGNRIDPLQLYSCDISEIKDRKSPFVSNVLHQLEKHGITSGITAVLSKEKATRPKKILETEQITTKNGEQIEFNKIVPSSTPFVASCAGIIMASIIVKKIIEEV